MKSVRFALLLILLSGFLGDNALAEFYVIPVGKRAKRTVLVSPKGTPEQNGEALRNALNSISDASDENPYLVKIEPGVYDVGSTPLDMKSYVDIEGSGRDITRIYGNVVSSSLSGVIRGSSWAALRQLSVYNSGSNSGTDAVGIFCDGCDGFDIQDVRITVTDAGDDCIGIHVYDFSGTIKLQHVIISVTGANDVGWGILANSMSFFEVDNTEISVYDNTNQNYGIDTISYAAFWISNCKIVVSSPWAHGVRLLYNSVAFIDNSYVDSDDYAVLLASDGGNVRIDHSHITGGNTSVRNDSASATFYVGATKIDGNVSGNVRCACAYNHNYQQLDQTCKLP